MSRQKITCQEIGYAAVKPDGMVIRSYGMDLKYAKQKVKELSLIFPGTVLVMQTIQNRVVYSPKTVKPVEKPYTITSHGSFNIPEPLKH